MTDGSVSDTLRQIKVAEVQAMRRPDKMRYLRAKGWHRVGNHWRRRGDECPLPFAAAVATQLLADMEST